MTDTNDMGPDEDLASFLRKHGLSGGKVLGIISGFGINSLHDLKTAREDSDIFGQLKEKFQGQPIVIKALDGLSIEAIDNAIFYSNDPDAEADADALADFLEVNDVLPDSKGRDRLLSILRSSGVSSLEGLRAIKERPASDAKRKALTANIGEWNQAAGASFESVTVAAVAKALRGGAAGADPELKSFIQKKRLPPGTEKELADFGITTLDQLKAVKQDKAPGGSLEQLKAKLDNSGIPLASKQLDAIKMGDIEQEIAEVSSPQAQDTSERSAELAKAIEKVEELRQKVKQASAAEFKTVKDDVDAQYKSVLETIKDVSGADFDSASTAATKSKDELNELLKTTISNATAVREMLEGVDKTNRTLARIISQQEMLCGFLITPEGAARKYSNLVKLPESPDQMSRDPGAHRDFSFKYKGSETKSFAVSSAQQASSTLATAASASGGGFVGSGVAAVSAAASYADAQRESTESKKFESATRAECGEIRYVYVPKQVVRFEKRQLRLSEGARERLEGIVKASADGQTDEVMNFFEEFGSHFFLRCSLGGRYQFTAKGKSDSESGKGLLINAVAQTTRWAASASGSYAGMGGAASAAASVEGQTSVAAAHGDRFALNFESAEVSVTTEVLGGAGLAPRDVWAQSLQYNSTWAVIDRDEPIAVWELLSGDSSLSSDVKKLAPLLEEVWVRRLFLESVRRSQPVLHNYIKENPTVTTCRALSEAIEQQNKEPELTIVVAMATSGSAEHPKVVASSSAKGLKLIGGGAFADFGGGAGLLLTGSYPEDNSWMASAKSHLISSPGTVTAYAIYLSDPYDLWDVAMVSASTEARSNRPEVTAKLPAGYALTGGGAMVDWGGPGMMLTACCPERDDRAYTGWTARAKDHLEGDAGNAKAWVFGIRPRNGLDPTLSTITVKTTQGQHPSVECSAPSGEVIIGGGAAVTWRGPGGMLTSSGLSSGLDPAQTWQAKAKDHKEGDSLDLKMWVISRNGRFSQA